MDNGRTDGRQTQKRIDSAVHYFMVDAKARSRQCSVRAHIILLLWLLLPMMVHDITVCGLCSVAVSLNIAGLRNVLHLCKQMKRLEVRAHFILLIIASSWVHGPI